MYELKPKRSVLKEEQETTINIDPNTGTAYVYTCMPYEIKKLSKLIGEPDVKLVLDDPYGMAIEVPAKWIKITKPRTMQLTDEQKEERRRHMAAMRLKKKEIPNA